MSSPPNGWLATRMASLVLSQKHQAFGLVVSYLDLQS